MEGLWLYFGGVVKSTPHKSALMAVLVQEWVAVVEVWLMRGHRYGSGPRHLKVMEVA